MPSTDEIDEARRDGSKSARRGLLPIANPYFDDRELAAAWREGYETEWSALVALGRKLGED